MPLRHGSYAFSLATHDEPPPGLGELTPIVFAQLHTATHLAKAQAGQLPSQTFESTIGASLVPATLSPAPEDGFVRYGDCVMLSSAQGGVLGIDTQTRAELVQESYSVTRTHPSGAVACTRTAWTVKPPPNTAAPEDGLLRVGMRFCLSAVGGDGKEYFLQSSRYTLHNQNYSHSVVGAQRKQGCCAAPVASAETVWEVVMLDPVEVAQMESTGQPVHANTFVALRHAHTQVNLCSDSHKVNNKYAGEYEVTAFTDSPLTKSTWGKRMGGGVGVTNHWAFTTAA